MNLNARLSIAVLLTLPLLAISCGGSPASTSAAGSPTGSPVAASPTNTEPVAVVVLPTATDEAAGETRGISLTPNPASVAITLEEGTGATAVIGSAGGVLETMDSRGTRYRLTVPDGALFSDEQITMTPILRAEGDAMGDTFQAGVSLHPEGLHFVELVTLEIAGDAIDAGTVGFAAEGGGQDLHLTISSQAEDTLTITATHFSEFGAATERFAEAIQAFVPWAADAGIEVILATGDDAEATAALQLAYQTLVNAGASIQTFEEWERWTGTVLSLFLRTGEVSQQRGWNENTPGLLALIADMQRLVDEWIRVSDRIAHSLGERCLDGDLVDASRLLLIIDLFDWFSSQLDLDPREEYQDWSSVALNCTNLGLTWQANIVTTGGNNFYSDISLAAEEQPLLPGQSESVLLEVDYIDGFFASCAGATPGAADLQYELELDTGNIGTVTNVAPITITVSVSMLDSVYIDCSNMTAGTVMTADAQYPFHGGALEKLNNDRAGADGGWVFDLEYDPGGGLVAQFEEGPKELPFSGGKYDLWQLISLYVISPEPGG